MEAYLSIFINFEHDNWARFLPIAEFTYNNIKNASTDHIHFELNCGYYLHISYKKDINLKTRSKLAEELSTKLRKLINMC